MTQDIQNAIINTQEYSSEMASVANVSNENIQINQDMMKTLMEQSEQIANNNVVVTEAMEQLQDKIDRLGSLFRRLIKVPVC